MAWNPRAAVSAASAGLLGLVGLVVSVAVLLLGVPFLVVGGLTRTLLLRLPLAPQWSPWRELMTYEPEVGWKPRPNLDAYGLGEEPFHLTTDGDGWRSTGSLEDSDVVVFGDSFAFGYGIGDEGFFANLLDRPRIKSIACNGYGMVHSLLWMRRLESWLAGKLAIWLVYTGNDLYENLRPNHGPYRTPFVRRRIDGDGWELVTAHVSPDPWPFPDNRRNNELLAQLCTPCLLGERAFSAAEYLIGEAATVCSAAGARLVLVSVPSSLQYGGARRLRRLSPDAGAFDPDLPDMRLALACERQGVPFVPLKPRLERDDYLDRDIHWRPSGHRKVATCIRDLW